jgi:hypothetical protein
LQLFHQWEPIGLIDELDYPSEYISSASVNSRDIQEKIEPTAGTPNFNSEYNREKERQFGVLYKQSPRDGSHLVLMPDLGPLSGIKTLLGSVVISTRRDEQKGPSSDCGIC